jgi:hypothetical protein
LSNREAPHRAIITFDVDIRALNVDGDVGPHRLSDERLSKYNIGKKAQFVISGVSEADCIKNVKTRLEKLNE